jgi:uncharacterized membrane protein
VQSAHDTQHTSKKTKQKKQISTAITVAIILKHQAIKQHSAQNRQEANRSVIVLVTAVYTNLSRMLTRDR